MATLLLTFSGKLLSLKRVLNANTVSNLPINKQVKNLHLFVFCTKKKLLSWFSIFIYISITVFPRISICQALLIILAKGRGAYRKRDAYSRGGARKESINLY